MLTELAALLDLLKAKGVTRFEGCYGEKSRLVKLEMSAPIDKAPPDARPGVDPDLCRCGHSNAEHTNGLCLAGCDAESCAPPETP